MSVREVVVADASVRVREWGSSGARALTYWHGLNPFGALELNEAGPAWAEAGFHVIALAAPGIADSPTLPDLADYRSSRLAGLVVGAADRCGLDRFVYVGWSWGASIGVHVAARFAPRLEALVLLDAGHTDIPGDPNKSLEDVLAEMSDQHLRYRFSSWDAFFAAARETRPNWRRELEDRLRAGMRVQDGDVVARSDRRAAAAAWHGLVQEQPSSAFEALARSGVPILLVLASQNDTANDVKRFRATVPHSEVATVNSGHDLLADAPEETIGLVAEWLSAHPAA